MSLPDPPAEALQASLALQSRIRQAILADEGWISFSRYMDLSLYTPGLGYYAGGAAKLGKDGDFTTAPEISALFGATLARFASDLFGGAPFNLLEFGAGTGKLAGDLLTAAADSGVKIASYQIVEVSSELRARQQRALANHPLVKWLDAPPAAFTGLVIANEVLDAMPVPLLVRRDGRWLERGVALDGSDFLFVDRECEQGMASQIPDDASLPNEYLTEVHPQQEGFMRLVGEMLRAGNGGAALMIDYGFPGSEYYLPQRSGGTLMCHYRHHAHADPFYLPGLQDITSHIDFSAMARAGLEAGLEVGFFMSQAAFLIGAGLPNFLEGQRAADPLHWLPLSNAIQKLTSPAEMGELFKAMLLVDRIEVPAQLQLLDQSYRL
ncbi:MAG: class I SAM-dependent methyltransferase [Oxalobacteraceae bacterium]|nr:class I SAM-dependent methyltransferase [Oxalobacteraceae bacterium]